jgi:hypothetical protein
VHPDDEFFLAMAISILGIVVAGFARSYSSPASSSPSFRTPSCTFTGHSSCRGFSSYRSRRHASLRVASSIVAYDLASRRSVRGATAIAIGCAVIAVQALAVLPLAQLDVTHRFAAWVVRG